MKNLDLHKAPKTLSLGLEDNNAQLLHRAAMKKSDKKFPLVSVIIPVFNDQVGLERTLAGLAYQEGNVEFEIIVVDNGSTPKVHIHRQDFPMHVLNAITCATPGSYAARNKGVQHAQGRILAFIDADCIPAKNWLIQGVSAIENQEYSSLIGGDVLIDLPPSPTAVSRYQCAFGFQQRANIELKGFGVTANLWVSRKLAKKIGLFREDLLSGGDYEWCKRAQSKGFTLNFAPNVIVTTFPRATLRDAIRQARRVVGGRIQLARKKTRPATHEETIKDRYRKESIRHRVKLIWALDYSLSQRLAVLSVAVLIWGAGQIEALRIKFGGTPERR